MRSVLFCLSALLLLSACNTIHGIGRDIESAGEVIGEGAQRTKEKMRR